MRRAGRMARVAGAIHIALGVAFGPAALWATSHLRRTGELPMTPFGFRALSGPFERLGTRWFSALGTGLAGLSALNVLAGRWLWRGDPRGLRLSRASFLPAMFLGAGFALPFLLIGQPIGRLLAGLGMRHAGSNSGTIGADE